MHEGGGSGTRHDRCAGCSLIRAGLAALVVLAVIAPARAQTPAEHEEHHPVTPAGPLPADQSVPSTPPSGPGGEMGQMMPRLPPIPPQAIYPSLMAVPELTPEARAELERLADERMKTGTALMLSGVERLAAAAATNDYAAMQEAGAQVREGLGQFESGAGTRRALAERRAPRDIALDWFRREMTLQPVVAPEAPRGVFGLTWFHLITMAILVSFAGTMVFLYFHKMRRAEALLTALAKGGGSSGGGSPPAAGGGSVATGSVVPPEPAPPSGPEPHAADVRRPWEGALRVIAVVPETADVSTFRLAVPQGGPLPFHFLPGQYLNLFVEVDGKPTKRAYTIASAPTHGRYAEVTVKREPFGVVSGYLHERIHVGDDVRVNAPHGSFVFTGIEAGSVVLIGGGVGITPLMSIIRHLTDQAWGGEIILLYSCKTAADAIYRHEMVSLQRRHANLRVVVTFTREEAPGMRAGRVTAALLADIVPGIVRSRVHVCGPRPMIAAVKDMLGRLGVPPDQVKTENFGTETRSPSAVAARAAPAPSPDPAPAALTGRIEPAVAAMEGLVSTITFLRSKKIAPAMHDKTLLDVAELAGVDIDSACRSGTCGSCKVPLQSGRVTMDVDDGLEAEDKALNLILACQAKPVGDVVVEA